MTTSYLGSYVFILFGEKKSCVTFYNNYYCYYLYKPLLFYNDSLKSDIIHSPVFFYNFYHTFIEIFTC